MKGRLDALLADKLESWELKALYKSYDIVGDIAVIRVPVPLDHRSDVIAKAVMCTNKHVKTVLRQTGSVYGGFRLRDLEWLAGKKNTITTHNEHGVAFKVDLKSCYFSPRLSYERMRIAKQVLPGEVIVNMFAGVGCYSILISKHAQPSKVYSIDINSEAVSYMLENIRLNKVQKRVTAIYGNARNVIQRLLRNTADRVLMPLPLLAYKYLDRALLAIKSTRGTIHYYEFEHSNKYEDPAEKVKERLVKRLIELDLEFEIPFHRVVRTTGPNWHQIALDIQIK